MATTLIRNIKKLLQVRPWYETRVKGAAMDTLPAIDNAWLLIDRGIISGFGSMYTCPERADKIVDATGSMVLPGWCDSHTHIVFAGSREQEFIWKIKGVSYEEIARRGGGILNSALRLRDTSEEVLVESALRRINEIRSMGTVAVEIKSGYGLSVEAELKMLRVIRTLKTLTPLDIKATFLGAHAIPLDYRDRREEYIRLVIEEMMPRIGDEQLADYCDVFCERGFFTPEETERIVTAARQYGMKPKIHANQMGLSGGVQAGVNTGAVSVDHLEYCGDEEIQALLNSETMPTSLPTAAWFLNLDFTPARKIIDAGLPLALATDYNPGSSPSGRMPLVMSMACIKMKMTPNEVINAVTINGAAAMDLSDKLGSIVVGKKASLIVTHPVPSIEYLPYAFGSDWIKEVIVGK